MAGVISSDPVNCEERAKEMWRTALASRAGSLAELISMSPAAGQAFAAANDALSNGSLSDQERALIALIVCERGRSSAGVAAAAEHARSLGISEERIAAARRARIEDDHRLDWLVKFVFRLIEKRGLLLEEEIRMLRDVGYSDGQVMEILVQCGLSHFLVLVSHAGEPIKATFSVPVQPA